MYFFVLFLDWIWGGYIFLTLLYFFLLGASPVVRDFGRGMCALEWASYCGRSKCVEIIEKYMDKMQLNPGLGCSTTLTLRSGHRFNSTQSLKRSSLPAALSNLTLTKGKESWVTILFCPTHTYFLDLLSLQHLIQSKN